MRKDRERSEEIRSIWREYSTFYRTLTLSLLIFAGIAAGSLIFGNSKTYLENLFTSALGVLITVQILDLLARRREENMEAKRLRESLLREVASPDNSVAKRAIHELRKRGLLDSGILRSEYLVEANLQGVSFFNADLKYADLSMANLQAADLQSVSFQGANLSGANLSYSILARADLRNAKLWETNLKEVDLSFADLSDANLIGANLERANLMQANLQHASLGSSRLQGANLQGAKLNLADLRGAEFDTQTILPDGAIWSPDTDITRFGGISSEYLETK